ncbi:MAG: hypothetical protein Q8P46_11600 [Hyphomicrobiales bacterium]|nr:hypothetical protein [Hyphomicrobiales bacterium]
MGLDTSTPVLLLGGQENALAVARHLGSHGIAVRVSGTASCMAMRSRYCRQSFPVPPGRSADTYWNELLLPPGNGSLHGHIVFACNDEAIEFMADHHRELEEHYLLDDSVPEIQHAMLDKMRTLELARAAGVPVPNFWKIRSIADAERLRGEVVFPVMVKPILSHKFFRVFGRKLFIIEDSFDELVQKVRLAHEHGMAVMVVEMIPGPDDLTSSYYTYIDGSGRTLLHLTKRVVRRHPVNRGGACYHITEWLPETAELGRKFFEGIRFRGLGIIEFKRDPRDGQLKVIEVNPRFTAPHRLIVNVGAPIDLIIYCHLTGQPRPQFDQYEQFRRMLYPLHDFLAFRQLRARGELSFLGWLRSILHRRTDFPVWSLSDPMPAIVHTVQLLRRIKEATDGN